MNGWLQLHVDKIAGNHQCGFSVAKSTLDQIQSVMQMPEKKTGIWSQHISSFHREKLLEAVKKFKVVGI
jgi:hypothetical protein